MPRRRDWPEFCQSFTLMDADTERLILAAREAARAVRQTCAETTALVRWHRESRSRLRELIASRRAASGWGTPDGNGSDGLGFGV